MNVQDFLSILLFVFQIMPLLILKHKYGCLIANMTHKDIIVNRHQINEEVSPKTSNMTKMI